MITAYIGLGSNLGDRLRNLQQALKQLGSSRCLAVLAHWRSRDAAGRNSGIRITGISPVYETVPVGGPDQPDYLNAVIEIETSLGTKELLDICLSVENEMGRERAEHWGARTIDIDILLYGDKEIETDRLILPHPRMHERAFVLGPLGDIAPQLLHPLLGRTVKELLEGLDLKGVRRMDDHILQV